MFVEGTAITNKINNRTINGVITGDYSSTGRGKESIMQIVF